MPKLTKEQRREKQRKRFLKYLDRTERGMYVDCDGRVWFKGLPEKQLGLPLNYRKRNRKHG
jgi:hypothetical protein